jgi:catechol 2,3-dioxygenase-like lactoylglutathione lyase family enzyme
VQRPHGDRLSVAHLPEERAMLSEYDPVAVLAVSDLTRARAFYEGTLGLVADEDVPEGVSYPAGGGRVLVYPSAFAGTNKATAVGFSIPAERFDAEIEQLRARGVTFDTFEAEGMTWVDGVAEMGGTRSAWFHDPDGNILAVETTT